MSGGWSARPAGKSRAGAQQFRQLDRCASRRKFARGTLEVATLESQTEQRLLDVRFAGIAAQDVIMVGRFVQPVGSDS